MVNPYTHLLHSSAREHFFGRQAELLLLERALSEPTTRSYALVGGPRLGKTALLLRFARLPHDRGQVIYVDCQQLSPDETLVEIGRHIIAAPDHPADDGDGVELREAIDAVARHPSGEEAMGKLRAALLRSVRARARAGQRLVICLDHFDNRWADQHAQSLVLRDLAGDASFVLAIAPATLETVQRHSPFVNMLFLRRIGLLSPAEAQELISAPALTGDRPWMEAEVAQIASLAGGHPYLLTLVCEELYERRHSSVLAGQLLRLDDRLQADLEQLPEIRRLFIQLWKYLPPDAQQILAHAAQQRSLQIDDRFRDSPAVGALRDWGLIDTDGATGNLVIFSALFARFVRSEAAPRTSPVRAALDELEHGLRGNEGQLLRYLRQRPGEIISVDELLQAIWGDASERHVVDQTLSRLRKRIRQVLPGHDDLIRGVRGQGYLLVNPE